MTESSTTFFGNASGALGLMVNWTLASGTSGDVGYLPNGQVEGAFNGNGGSTWWYEQYLWVGQRLMAYYDPDWNTYFIHRGGNGSSTQITNESGGLAGDMLFYPFGQEWQYDNGVNSAWWQFYNSFSRWNASLGFDLTPNRKYSPTLGRWMTPDPSGMAAASPSNPQTWNMYAYVLNNPTSLVDTSGLTCVHTDSGETVDNMDGKGCAAMNHNPEDVNVSAQAPLNEMSLYQLAAAGIESALGGPVTTSVGGAFGGGSAAKPGLPRTHGPTSSCTSAKSRLASMGSQLSGIGKRLMGSGIAVLTISSVGAIIAPEALPAEAGGGEFGANLLEVGGAASALGGSLEGYAQGGLTRGIKDAFVSVLVDQISSRLAGGLLGRIAEGTKSGTTALLKQIPEALLGAEAACGG